MYTLKVLTVAAVKMFVRNRQALFFTFFMPFVIMSIFGFVGIGGEQQINIGVVAQSPNQATTSFIEGLKNIDSLAVFENSKEQEEQTIADGERALVIFVPNNLIPQEAPTSPAELRILTSSSEPQSAQIGLAIVNQALNQARLFFAEAPELFTVVIEDVNARDFRYIDFLIPGVVAIAIMQLGVFSVAFYFTDLKQKGILKRLLATPMKPWQFVSANIITRLLVGILQAVILIGVGVLLFNYVVSGSLWLILLIIVLGSVMFLGLGFTISGIATTVESVPAIANLVVFPMLFLGDTFFPISNMPEWLGNIVQYLPLTFFSQSLRAVLNEGASGIDIISDVTWMLVWAIFLVFLSTLTFSFEEKKV